MSGGGKDAGGAKYKISDLSRMAGLSTQTVRRYEEQGILRASREGENGYRLYNAYDLAALIRVRMYRNYGFSLKEIAALFQSDLAENADLFEARIARMEREAELAQRRMDCARAQMAALRAAPAQIGVFTELTLPPSMGIFYRRKTKMLDTEGLGRRIAAWSDMTPMVQPLVLIRREDFLQNRDDYHVGLRIDLADAALCGIQPDVHCVPLPAGRCLQTVVQAENELDFAASGHLTRMDAYLKEHSLTLRGDLMGGTLTAVQSPSGSTCHYQRVYLPV